MTETKKELPVEKKEDNYFIRLNDIDVSKKVEKKNGLNYLSWAWSWTELKKIHPNANYKIYETVDGCFYWTDGKTCWVKTSVTVNELEHIEYLPIMNYKNKSIPLADVTSFDVNTSIQRSLTKAAARHGLGLYVYAGEDLPNQTKDDEPDKKDGDEEETQLISEKMLNWFTTNYLAQKTEEAKAVLLDGISPYTLETLKTCPLEEAKIKLNAIRENAKNKQNA
jgi:hypothetical protein